MNDERRRANKSMHKRFRIVVTSSTGDYVQLLAIARRQLAISIPDFNPDSPQHQTRCDENGRAYFEFSTGTPSYVQQAIRNDPKLALLDILEVN